MIEKINLKKVYKIFLLCFCIQLCPIILEAQQTFIFEDLGKPIRTEIPVEFITNNKKTGPIAWASLTDANRSALVGINVTNGKIIEVDLSHYGKANAVMIFKHSDQVIYIYAGLKGRFFKYDVSLDKLTQMGEPSHAAYWMKSSYTIASDGKIYVGTYPNASVSILDPIKETVTHIDQVSSSKGTEYVINPASSKDGYVFFPTGMHHGELWAYNTKTKKRNQILPKNLQSYGPPVIWLAEDGNVYGRKGGVSFRCTPDGIKLGETKPKLDKILKNEFQGKAVLFIDRDGSLVLEDLDTKVRSFVRSSFQAPAEEIFSLGALHQGKLYGSSIKPGNIFSYDIKDGEMEDLGIMTRGRIQAYDILSYKNGLFISSYTGGYIDYFPDHLKLSFGKRLPVASLHKTSKQERLVQLTVGPDGKIYSPTVPIKGYLGGVLVQVDPEDFSTRTFPDLISNQSFTSVTSIPETNELFITSSIYGGSSSKPIEKEAVIFLWNIEEERVTYKTSPIENSIDYSKAVRAPNGLLYGFSRDKYYVFDPVKRRVVYKGMLTGRLKPSNRNVVLSEQLGPDGLLYGIDNITGNLISINPDDHKVAILAQDDTLIKARFAEVYPDGYLYYPNHASLMRVKVVK